MATVKIFQLYDTNARTVTGPMLQSENAAPFIREFKRLLGDKNTDVGKFPEDFELRELGEQETETGELYPITPKTLYSGQQWLLDQNNGMTSALPSRQQNGPTPS